MLPWIEISYFVCSVIAIALYWAKAEIKAPIETLVVWILSPIALVSLIFIERSDR